MLISDFDWFDEFHAANARTHNIPFFDVRQYNRGDGDDDDDDDDEDDDDGDDGSFPSSETTKMQPRRRD